MFMMAELGDAEGVAAPYRSEVKPIVTDEMLDVALAVGPYVMRFHYRLPGPDMMDRMREYRIKVICTATTPGEASALQDQGADAAIAHGAEAGGHPGTHRDPRGYPQAVNQIGTFALISAVRDAVAVPAIAAGGIAEGRGLAAAFLLGADGVQMGTAILQCS